MSTTRVTLTISADDHLSPFLRRAWYAGWLLRLRCLAAVRAARRAMQAR